MKQIIELWNYPGLEWWENPLKLFASAIIPPLFIYGFYRGVAKVYGIK